ncbi:MAG: hypothetical protein R3F34_07800 [Planctomycetota bacterium]
MSARRAAALTVWIAALAACANRAAYPATDAVRLEADATAFVASIPDVLAERGPTGWLDLFVADEPFDMLSDGTVVFADRAAAEAFLPSFAADVVRMDLHLREVRSIAIGEGAVSVAALYDETIDTRGAGRLEFGGAVSMVVVVTSDGFRLRRLHWSSPRVDDGA